MTYPSAIQYTVELERERAAAVARAEEAESDLARAWTRIKDLESISQAAEAEAARAAEQLADLERERDDARKSAEGQRNIHGLAVTFAWERQDEPESGCSQIAEALDAESEVERARR